MTPFLALLLGLVAAQNSLFTTAGPGMEPFIRQQGLGNAHADRRRGTRRRRCFPTFIGQVSAAPFFNVQSSTNQAVPTFQQQPMTADTQPFSTSPDPTPSGSNGSQPACVSITSPCTTSQLGTSVGPQCCMGLSCVSGLCRPCLSMGGQCGSTGDCCGSLLCTKRFGSLLGTCTNPDGSAMRSAAPDSTSAGSDTTGTSCACPSCSATPLQLAAIGPRDPSVSGHVYTNWLPVADL